MSAYCDTDRVRGFLSDEPVWMPYPLTAASTWQETDVLRRKQAPYRPGLGTDILRQRQAQTRRPAAAKPQQRPQQRPQQQGDKKDVSWQLRDANGLWITMSSTVQFTKQGKPMEGKVVGTPRPGVAQIRLPNGQVVTMPTRAISVVSGAGGNALGGKSTDRGGGSGKGGGTGTSINTGRGSGGGGGQGSAGSSPRSSMSGARSRAVERAKEGSSGADKPKDSRLESVHRISRSIETLLRERALALGLKSDPFGEQERRGGSERSGSSDSRSAGEAGSSEEGGGSSEEGGGSTPARRRKDTRKKLTRTQIDAVGRIMKVVLKAIREGQYGNAETALARAESLIKNTSAPWLSKRINFLQKGIGVVEKATGRATTASLTAGGDSWTWQLRDGNGRWIEMGSEVKWASKGQFLFGTVIGSPEPKKAEIQTANGRRHIVSSRSLFVVAGADEAEDVPVPQQQQQQKRTVRAVIQPQTDPLKRPSQAKTSLADYGPEEQAFINNAGTPDDPAHFYEGGEHGGALVRQSVVEAHYRDVLRLALKGVAVNPKVDPASVAAAKDWYRTAHRIALDLAAEITTTYPDRTPPTLQQVAGVLAAMSPRMRWPQNIEAARKILHAHYSGALDRMSLEEAKKMTKAGSYTFVEDSLLILQESDPEVLGDFMTGLKRKSFWNNIVDPENDYDLTIDGWMLSAVWRMGGEYEDGTPFDTGMQAWLEHGQTRNKMTVVEQAGYVIMADALRNVARDLGLSPSEAQAMYWVAVGGGEPNTQMWSLEPKNLLPMAGYTKEGNWKLTKTLDITDYPFWGRGKRAQSFRYGHLRVYNTPDGTWRVQDPFAPAGHPSTYRTRKDALDAIHEQYPDGPLIHDPRIRDADAVRVHTMRDALVVAPQQPPLLAREALADEEVRTAMKIQQSRNDMQALARSMAASRARIEQELADAKASLTRMQRRQRARTEGAAA